MRTCLLSIGLILGLLASAQAGAEPTNAVLDGEAQGRALVQKILGQLPDALATNVGVLQIRDGDKRTELAVTCRTTPVANGWTVEYTARSSGGNQVESIIVEHSASTPNRYEKQTWHEHGVTSNSVAAVNQSLTGTDIFAPFAGSDFWFVDLGLEFFHWPQQKVVQKEFYHNCACMVLESTTPHPAANGYSRVDAWIDEGSLGIVKAVAYDANGGKLKEFYPKSLEKINGRYQLESMVMVNAQTGSESTFKFKLEK